MLKSHELAGVSHSEFIRLPLAERDRYTELALDVESRRSKSYEAGYDADTALFEQMWDAINDAKHFLRTNQPTKALESLNEV